MSNVIQLQQPTSIIATRVDESKRLDFFPTMFGGEKGITIWPRVESNIIAKMKKLSPDYQEAFWEYYALSNGGCYMAPVSQPQFRIYNQGCNFNELMSADAAGILVCLFTWHYLATITENDHMIAHYFQLKNYAMIHEEARLIARLLFKSQSF